MWLTVASSVHENIAKNPQLSTCTMSRKGAHVEEFNGEGAGHSKLRFYKNNFAKKIMPQRHRFIFLSNLKYHVPASYDKLSKKMKY